MERGAKGVRGADNRVGCHGHVRLRRGDVKEGNEVKVSAGERGESGGGDALQLMCSKPGPPFTQRRRGTRRKPARV